MFEPLDATPKGSDDMLAVYGTDSNEEPLRPKCRSRNRVVARFRFGEFDRQVIDANAAHLLGAAAVDEVIQHLVEFAFVEAVLFVPLSQRFNLAYHLHGVTTGA